MKALSLWQPWASAVALGLKRHETRGQDTRHRGELAICATKPEAGGGAALVAFAHMMREVELGFSEEGRQAFLPLRGPLPYGACVAVAALTDTLQVVDPQELRAQGVTVPSFVVARARDHWHRVLCWSWARSRPEWLELAPADFLLGDYAVGRWVYVLRDVRRLVSPVYVRGAQGVFALDLSTRGRIVQAAQVEVPYP